MYGNCFQVVCLKTLSAGVVVISSTVSGNSLEKRKTMEWFPIVFFTFKALVLGTGMFFAIKWHYDQGKKENGMDRRTLVIGVAKVVLIFVVLLAVLGYLTLLLVRKLGLDWTIP
jgi:Ni/Fe-hydrogenase subunit HybB-like protein